MKGKILVILLLLVLAAAAMTSNAKGQARAVDPTQTPVIDIPDLTSSCRVTTGIEGGAVNLRACGSVCCAVLDILTEGERLRIVTAGAWVNVTTEAGLTGWVNSTYCKGK